MYVEFNVKFPAPYWTEASKLTALEKILPAREALPDLKGKETEEVVLSEVTLQQQKAMDVDEDDDDERGHGGPGVQCAQQ